MKKETKKSATAPKTRNRQKVKPLRFGFRHTNEVGDMMRDKAEKRGMNVSDYLAYLVKKDKPK